MKTKTWEWMEATDAEFERRRLKERKNANGNISFLRRFRRIGNRGARITLSVALGNVAAEAFYRQLGFAEIAKVVEMTLESV